MHRKHPPNGQEAASAPARRHAPSANSSANSRGRPPKRPVQPTDIAVLRRAATKAAEFPIVPGPLMEADVPNDFYLVIEDIAGEDAEVARERDRLDQIIQEMHREELRPPSDVACELWSPKVDAAYYLGVAVGFRVALALKGGVQ